MRRAGWRAIGRCRCFGLSCSSPPVLQHRLVRHCSHIMNTMRDVNVPMEVTHKSSAPPCKHYEKLVSLQQHMSSQYRAPSKYTTVLFQEWLRIALEPDGVHLVRQGILRDLGQGTEAKEGGDKLTSNVDIKELTRIERSKPPRVPRRRGTPFPQK